MSELRGATVAFKLAETATQAVLAVGGQAAMGADVGLRDVAENGLAMMLTEAAMKPFAGLFAGNAAIEAEVKTLSRRAMSAGATVGHAAIETGVSIAASHVARAAIHGGELDAAATEEIVTQGLSIAAGRIVGHHMAEMHARIKQAEHEYRSDYLATLRERARALSERALGNERPTRDEALAMLAEEHRLFLEERAAYGDGPAHAKARAESAATLGATDARFLDVPLQLAGLSPVVDGHVYEGDWATVDRAFKAVADSGLPINPVWHPESNSWHVHLGERVVTVHVRETAKAGEQAKTPTTDGHGPPRPIPDEPAVPKRAHDHAEAQAQQSPTKEPHGAAPSAAESASASRVPPAPKDGWVRSAEQKEALDAARNGNPTKEQRTHLQDEIRRQVPDVALAEAIHDGHAKSVVSVVFPGGGEHGIKTMNDDVLGMRFNDRLIADRNAAVRAAFELQGLQVVSVDHKTVSLVSDKPAADIGKRLDAALALVDALMPAIIRNHLGIAKDYYRRVVDGFESRPHNEGDRDNVDYTGAKKHLAEIAKLEGTMKASDKLGPFKTRVEVGAADLHGTDYSSLLEAEMNASKAAIMARDTADPRAEGRAKVYSQEDFVEFAHDTMKLRDELVAEKAVLPIHGEQRPVIVGGHLDPEVLWAVRKKKLDVVDPGQQKTLDKVARYVTRVNALDYMASFTGAEVSQHGAKVERAREAMAKLDGDKAVSKQAAAEVEAILKGSVAQQNAPSEAQFFNAAAETTGDRIVLNADIKDLGIDLWVDLEQAMEHLDASAKDGRAQETRADVRNTSVSATDQIVLRKQKIQSAYKAFYERMLEQARAKAAGRPELLRALEHEQHPLYLQGGDEITLSISPAFRSLGLEVDFARWLIKYANARVAVTEARTSGSGGSTSVVEAHKKAMNDADPGHKVLKKYEEVRRVLDKKLKAKTLVGEKLSVGSQARNAIERMYTDVDAGGNTVVKSETDIQLIRQYSEEALGKDVVAKILDGKEKPDGD